MKYIKHELKEILYKEYKHGASVKFLSAFYGYPQKQIKSAIKKIGGKRFEI